MTPDSLWFRVLDPVADAFNPALTLFALAVPGLRGSWRGPWAGWWAALRYVAAALAGLGVVYGVAALDARFGLWSSLGLDYSTHFAYAVSLATTIVCWDRRWARPLALALGGYAVLILFLGYHGPADVLTAALVAVPGAWAAMMLLGPRPGRAVPTTEASRPARPTPRGGAHG